MSNAPERLMEQSMSNALSVLLQQLPESVEATEEWQEIVRWAEEIYRETGRPATLDDLYRDLPTLYPDDDLETPEPES